MEMCPVCMEEVGSNGDCLLCHLTNHPPTKGKYYYKECDYFEGKIYLCTMGCKKCGKKTSGLYCDKKEILCYECVCLGVGITQCPDCEEHYIDVS
jgi:hypothetical protein